MVAALTSIAPLTALTPDVGVVEVRADEIIYLLCGSAGYTTARRSTEGDEAKAIHLVELLLYAEEVAPGIVVLPTDVGVLPIADTAGDAGCEAPAILALSRGIGIGEAVAIGEVAIRVGEAMLRAKHRGACRHVVSHADGTKARDDGLEGLRGLLLAGDVVETAPERPCRVATVEVVHPDAVEHLLIVLGVVATVAEASRAEDVARSAEEGVA